MHTRSLAPTAVAAALMTLLVIAAAIVTRGDGAEPVRTLVPAATPEPDGAEEWMYLQRANADGSILGRSRQRGDITVEGDGAGEQGLAGHRPGVD